MATKDTALVNALLDEFVAALGSRFEGKIDFILLFGSAARGEFRAGISDIDLIIQVRDDADRDAVEKHAERIFWKLDRKHGTGLHGVCSTKRDDFFSMFEKNVRLYKPFEVVGPDDIRWAEGRIEAPGLGAFTALAPVSQFAKKVKKEGKVLYGRNILAEIVVREPLADKVKALLMPYAFSLIAIPVAFIAPDKGLKYSIKAVLYGIDNQLSIIERGYSRRTHLNVMMLRNAIGEQYSVRLAREALGAKKDFERVKKEWSYIDKLFFCLQAPFYIAHNNAWSVAAYFARILHLRPSVP